MTLDQFNTFCAALPATTHVVQWGGAHVWKVGGKVFVIGRFDDAVPGVSFKTSELAFQMLSDRPGLRPAPYLASRGLKWIEHYAKPGLRDADLRGYVKESYRMIAAALPKSKRRNLGLDVPPQS